jgi:hypothetical protein
MDLYDRVARLEERVAELELLLRDRTNITRPDRPVARESKKTTYLPAITEEMSELSKLDDRVEREEETRVERVREKRVTSPELVASVDAVSKAIELLKLAEELVEAVQHISKLLMDSKK